jgi:hypothetical protein
MYPRAGTLLIAVSLLLPLACGGSPKRTQYVRVVEPTGRAYYAETSHALYSEVGGFVTFRDLVTRDEVRLANGRYSATPCSEDEVAKAQTAFLQDPKKPAQSEFDPEKGMDPRVWR